MKSSNDPLWRPGLFCPLLLVRMKVCRFGTDFRTKWFTGYRSVPIFAQNGLLGTQKNKNIEILSRASLWLDLLFSGKYGLALGQLQLFGKISASFWLVLLFSGKYRLALGQLQLFGKILASRRLAGIMSAKLRLADGQPSQRSASRLADGYLSLHQLFSAGYNEILLTIGTCAVGFLILIKF